MSAILKDRFNEAIPTPSLLAITGTVTYQDVWKLPHHLTFHATYAGGCDFSVDQMSGN